MNMDLQAFVNKIAPMTCIMSVEELPDGKYGEIRIVAGNKAYIDSIELADHGPQMMCNKFIPNSLYQNYFPKDLNFEDICYRAAVKKEPLFTYVHPDRFDFWFALQMLPLDCDNGNLRYCTYTQEISQSADTSKMSNISHDTASAVIETCIKLRSTDDFQKAMDEVIKGIRELCDARSCTVLMMDTVTRKCSVLSSAAAFDSSVVPIRSRTEGFYEVAESWEGTIAGSNCLIIKNESDMEVVKNRNPVWHRSLTESGVRSIVLFPLKYKGDLLGYIWATNFNTENATTIKETLELTTFFLAAEIANYRMLNRLKILSSQDLLTGVLNRNEMNNRIDRICERRDETPMNVGIVFADLNGLKMVNDKYGHFAGDMLIKNAALLLQNVFMEEEVYRAGGDEFMVLVKNTTIEMLEEKCNRLKEQSGAFEHVSFAVGYSIEEDGINIRRSLKLADERMYEDKERYYQEHPELKR